MPKLSKRLASLVTKVEERTYEPLEAIQLVKDNANAKSLSTRSQFTQYDE